MQNTDFFFPCPARFEGKKRHPPERGCRLFLEFLLNGLVVVGIGAGGFLAEHLAFCHLTDEHHMASQIQLFQNLAAEHCVGMLCQVDQVIVAAGEADEIGKFVHIPSGLHSKMTKSV